MSGYCPVKMRLHIALKTRNVFRNYYVIVLKPCLLDFRTSKRMINDKLLI
jgi:hypothetical protein